VEAKSQVSEATIEVTVIRKNGDREELGVVSYWHRNPLKRLMWRFGWRP